MLGFNEIDKSDDPKIQLLNEILLISNARYSYNLELHDFFSDASKKDEIADFWDTITPFSQEPRLSDCLKKYQAVAQSKSEIYKDVRLRFSQDLSTYHNVRLLEGYFSVLYVQKNTAADERIVLDLYEKALKNAKLSSGHRKRILKAFREMTIESSHLKQMTAALENYLVSQGAIYREFIAQVEIFDDPHRVSNYAPSKFYDKNQKKISKISEKLKEMVKLNEKLPVVAILFAKKLKETEAAFIDKLRKVSIYKNGSSHYDDVNWYFEHFKELYELSQRVDRLATGVDQLISKVKSELNCMIVPEAVASETELPIAELMLQSEPELEFEHVQDVTIAPQEASTSSTAIENFANEDHLICSSSSDVDPLSAVSLQQMTQELAELQLADEVILDTPPNEFIPHWKLKERQQVSRDASFAASSQPEPESLVLTKLAEKLLKAKFADTLRRLFSERIHKAFSFQELIKLVEICGGSVQNTGGSVRRIILGKFASDTLEIVKLNVHAPHGKHNDKDLLPSCIVKHFKCVLMQAGITPKTVFGEEVEALRTPAASSSTMPANDSKMAAGPKEAPSKHRRRVRR